MLIDWNEEWYKADKNGTLKTYYRCTFIHWIFQVSSIILFAVDSTIFMAYILTVVI